MYGSKEELDQERIWIEASKKDINHFEPLYNKYYEPLFRFFARRTDDEVLADELCSNTFYKALRSIKKFKWQGKPFGAWLFRIGTNELRRHFRDQAPIYVIETDKLVCADEGLEVADQKSLDHLMELLDELSEMDLRILELRFFEELSFKEISILLDVGESAMKMRVYRLLGKLRKQLEQS